MKKLKKLLLLPLVMVIMTTSQAQQNTKLSPILSLLLFDQDPAKIVAYVWANQSTNPGPYTPNRTYSYNMSGGGVSITRRSAGLYEVELPGLKFIEGNLTAGFTSGAAILVSAAHPDEAYCTLFTRRESSFIVSCAESTNATVLSDARFMATVVQTTNQTSDVGIGFFHRIKNVRTQLPAIGQTKQLTSDFYSSVGESINIRKIAVGNYRYTYEGAVSLIHSTPQVTLIDNAISTPKKGHCTVDASGNNSFVKCFDLNGNPIDASHEVMIGWNNAPGNAKILAYAMTSPTGTEFASGDFYNSSGGETQIIRESKGTYLINFIGLDLPGNSQTDRQYNLQINAVSINNETCTIGSIFVLSVFCSGLNQRSVDSGFSAVMVGYE